MESPPRRSAIPVSTSISSPSTRRPMMMSGSMTKSKESLLDDGDDSAHHAELRTFTLLEENIALKETRDSLVNKNVDRKYLYNTLIIC